MIWELRRKANSLRGFREGQTMVSVSRNRRRLRRRPRTAAWVLVITPGEGPTHTDDRTRKSMRPLSSPKKEKPIQSAYDRFCRGRCFCRGNCIRKTPPCHPLLLHKRRLWSSNITWLRGKQHKDTIRKEQRRAK